MGRLLDFVARALPGPAGDQALLLGAEAMTREAVAEHMRTRRALALAAAAGAREADKGRAILRRTAELEARAVAAIAGGRDDLAVLASEAIAALEAEAEASAAAQRRHDAAIARLGDVVDDQRRRLADLERGRRLAAVQAAVADAGALHYGAALRVAEDALMTLEARHDDAMAVAADLSVADPRNGDRLSRTMAAAGFGDGPRSRAGDVLARLRAAARDVPQGDVPERTAPALTAPHRSH